MSTDEARIRSEKLSRALSQVNEMHKILGSDLNHAIDFARRYPSQFADRTLIRTYAALIEGTSYQLRSCVLEFAADYPGTFSTHEIMVLAERKHSLNQWGEVELVKDNYRSTLPLLLLTIRCYGRLCAVDFHPKVKEGNHPTQGWQSTRAFFALRDELAHPKNPQSMNIDDSHRQLGEETLKWFNGELSRLGRAAIDKLPHLRVEETGVKMRLWDI